MKLAADERDVEDSIHGAGATLEELHDVSGFIFMVSSVFIRYSITEEAGTCGKDVYRIACVLGDFYEWRTGATRPDWSRKPEDVFVDSNSKLEREIEEPEGSGICFLIRLCTG